MDIIALAAAIDFDFIVRFLVDYGAYIGPLVAFIFYLFEIYINLGRTDGRSAFEKFVAVAFLFVAATSVAGSYYLLNREFEKKTPETRAAEEIRSTHEHCLGRAKSLPEPERKAVERTNAVGQSSAIKSVEFQCLALAIQRHAPQMVSVTPSVAFGQDLQLGTRLLGGQDAQANVVAESFRGLFGVNRSTFLGTGYTIPGDSRDRRSEYSEAVFREYVSLNYCAQSFIDVKLCPGRHSQVWAWILPVNLETLGRKVGDIIFTEKPQEGDDQFEPLRQKATYRVGADGVYNVNEHILVRFQKFPAEYYRGTVGRPDAAYVFFSELQQTQGLTVRDALTGSGAREKAIDDMSTDQRIFIWVVAYSNTDYQRLATWRNLFALLRDYDVDPRLVRHVDAKQ